MYDQRSIDKVVTTYAIIEITLIDIPAMSTTRSATLSTILMYR